VLNRIRFNSDRGSTYTASSFTSLCSSLTIRQSMGRVGSCFDNAAAEAWFSTLEWELLRHRTFATRADAAREISRWTYEFYNGRRRPARSACRRPSATSNPLPFSTSPPNQEASTGAGEAHSGRSLAGRGGWDQAASGGPCRALSVSCVQAVSHGQSTGRCSTIRRAEQASLAGTLMS